MHDRVDPGQQPAAAERRHDRRDVGQVLEDFEAGRRVAREMEEFQDAAAELGRQARGQAREQRVHGRRGQRLQVQRREVALVGRPAGVAFGQLRWGRGVTISIFLVPLLVIGIVLISRYLLRERR